MALGLLQLCLTLLWALMTQATNSAEKALWRPSLSNSPKQGGFQDKKFQGKWGIMAWALNTFVNESLSNMDMVSTTFELKDDHSYSVTSLWYSDQGCFTQQDRLVRSGLRSQYIMEDVTRYKGLQSFTMKVLDTNYRDYAVVFYHANVDNKEYIECILYAKNWEKKHRLRVYFYFLTMLMDFHPQNIHFTEPKNPRLPCVNFLGYLLFISSVWLTCTIYILLWDLRIPNMRDVLSFL